MTRDELIAKTKAHAAKQRSADIAAWEAKEKWVHPMALLFADAEIAAEEARAWDHALEAGGYMPCEVT